MCSTPSGDKAMDDDEDYLLFTAIANWFIGGGAEGWEVHEPTREGATSSSSPSSATQRVILVLLLPLLQRCCCLKRQLRTF